MVALTMRSIVSLSDTGVSAPSLPLSVTRNVTDVVPVSATVGVQVNRATPYTDVPVKEAPVGKLSAAPGQRVLIRVCHPHIEDQCFANHSHLVTHPFQYRRFISTLLPTE